MISPNPYRIAAGVWTVSVVALSLSPTLPSAAALVSDKIEHLAAYGLLSFLAIMGWRNVTAGWRLAVAAALVGALMEGLQAVVPGRSPEWLDLVANSTGALIGLVAATSLARLGTATRHPDG